MKKFKSRAGSSGYIIVPRPSWSWFLIFGVCLVLFQYWHPPGKLFRDFYNKSSNIKIVMTMKVNILPKVEQISRLSQEFWTVLRIRLLDDTGKMMILCNWLTRRILVAQKSCPEIQSKTLGLAGWKDKDYKSFERYSGQDFWNPVWWLGGSICRSKVLSWNTVQNSCNPRSHQQTRISYLTAKLEIIY